MCKDYYLQNVNYEDFLSESNSDIKNTLKYEIEDMVYKNINFMRN
jgi:hypothetical protein